MSLRKSDVEKGIRTSQFTPPAYMCSKEAAQLLGIKWLKENIIQNYA